MSEGKHPKALLICSLTEFWERYGFYISQGLMALMLIKVFSYTERFSFAITGTYVGLVYTTSIVGGLIADKFIGHYRAVILGEVLLVSGFLLSGFSIVTIEFPILAIALACISVGTGLVKSNVSAFLGHFYSSTDPKRDLGFSVFYIAINIGSVIGGIIAGYLSTYLGWSVPFFTAAIGAFVGFLTIVIGVMRNKMDFEKSSRSINFKQLVFSLVATVITIAACVYIILSPDLANLIFILIAVISMLLLLLTAITQPHYAKNCLAYFILIVISVIFWAIFFQMFSSFVVFIDHFVDHYFLGLFIPTSSFFTIESIGIVVLGGFVGKFWAYRAKKGKPVHDAVKFTISMFVTSISFLILAIVLNFHSSAVLLPAILMIFIYLLISVADLCLSPIGLSVANKLAPLKSRGLFMGIWMISIGLGGKLSGILAEIASTPDETITKAQAYDIYDHALWIYFLISISACIVIGCFVPFMKKIMK